MSVKIRLTRTGARNNPSYRLVATESRNPRDGRCLEILGWYDPKRQGQKFKLDLDKIDAWVGKGAQLSATAKTLVSQSRKQQAQTVAETAKAS